MNIWFAHTPNHDVTDACWLWINRWMLTDVQSHVQSYIELSKQYSFVIILYKLQSFTCTHCSCTDHTTKRQKWTICRNHQSRSQFTFHRIFTWIKIKEDLYYKAAASTRLVLVYSSSKLLVSGSPVGAFKVQGKTYTTTVTNTKIQTYEREECDRGI